MSGNCLVHDSTRTYCWLNIKETSSTRNKTGLKFEYMLLKVNFGIYLGQMADQESIALYNLTHGPGSMIHPPPQWFQQMQAMMLLNESLRSCLEAGYHGSGVCPWCWYEAEAQSTEDLSGQLFSGWHDWVGFWCTNRIIPEPKLELFSDIDSLSLWRPWTLVQVCVVCSAPQLFLDCQVAAWCRPQSASQALHLHHRWPWINLWNEWFMKYLQVGCHQSPWVPGW